MKFRTMIIALMAMATLGATAQSTKKTEPSHGINIKNLDKSVKPGTDFFTFANGGWQKANPIGDEYATFGSFHQLDELNNTRIRGIIEGLAAQQNAKGSIEDNIATLYNMSMDTVTQNKQGLKPLEFYLAFLNANDKASLMSAAALYMLSDVNCFFGIGVESDAKDSKKNLVQLHQGGITLGEMEYYLDTDEHTLEIRNAYREFGTKAFKMLYPQLSDEEAKAKMNTVIRIETRLASAFKNNTQLRIAENNYNKITFAQLEQDYPELNWKKLFFEDSRFPAFDEINVGQPEAIKQACAVIREEPVEDLRTYMTFRLMASSFSLLGQEQKDLSFDFFGKTLQGRKVQQPLWKRSVELTNNLLGEAVGQIYVQKYFPASAKTRMEQLVENLRVALGERIQAQEWMSDETKTKYG